MKDGKNPPRYRRKNEEYSFWGMICWETVFGGSGESDWGRVAVWICSGYQKWLSLGNTKHLTTFDKKCFCFSRLCDLCTSLDAVWEDGFWLCAQWTCWKEKHIQSDMSSSNLRLLFLPCGPITEINSLQKTKPSHWEVWLSSRAYASIRWYQFLGWKRNKNILFWSC